MKKNQLWQFIVLSLIFVPQTQAFTLNNSLAAAFPQDSVKVNVASHACVNIGITNSELLSIAEEASNTFWNRAPSSRLNLERGDLVSVDDKFRTDAVCTGTGSNSCTPNPDLIVSSNILISCNVDTSNNNFSSSGILAITVSNNISGADINGALILLNDKAGTSLANRTHAEWVAIIAHEIGHAIGLGHSPVRDSLMFFTLVPKRSYLGQDDIDGVTYLYPAEQPFSGGCGSIAKTKSTPPSGNFPGAFFLGLALMGLLIKVLKSSSGSKTSTAIKT